MYFSFKSNIDGARLLYNKVKNPKGAVIICPGGGYKLLSPRESWPVANEFAKNGWQGFILEYSIGENLGIRPLQELSWAINTIKENSKNLDLDLEHKPLVLCGFSAGGHLAASYGVHWDDDRLFSIGEQIKPDGLILCYPVITAGEYAHRGSIDALVGNRDRDYFSLEKHVNKNTPPTFIWHTADDESVPVQNTLLFVNRLVENGVSVEAHIYPHGVHGLSLATKEVEQQEQGRLSDEHIASWFNLCIGWLETIINDKGDFK